MTAWNRVVRSAFVSSASLARKDFSDERVADQWSVCVSGRWVPGAYSQVVVLPSSPVCSARRVSSHAKSVRSASEPSSVTRPLAMRRPNGS